MVQTGTPIPKSSSQTLQLCVSYTIHPGIQSRSLNAILNSVFSHTLLPSPQFPSLLSPKSLNAFISLPLHCNSPYSGSHDIFPGLLSLQTVVFVFFLFLFFAIYNVPHYFPHHLLHTLDTVAFKMKSSLVITKLKLCLQNPTAKRMKFSRPQCHGCSQWLHSLLGSLSSVRGHIILL